MKLTPPTTAIALAVLTSSARAWSAIGHEIVATIAQIHLTPNTASAVAAILPPETDGQLAAIAAWADSIRFSHRDTAQLHYVNPLKDDPKEVCTFGEEGWTSGDRNLLKALGNYTRRVKDGEGDIPLRFLTHFVGDLHQPLHLTGKLRGGNGAITKFEGRRSSLHSTWDGLMIQKSIRELGNYTTRLPSKRIESALRGKTYDPYVRFIVSEAIHGFWRAESIEWPSCPDYAQPQPALLPIRQKNLLTHKPRLLPAILQMWGVPNRLIFRLPDSLRKAIPTYVDAFPDAEEKSGELPVCPFAWAKEMHALNCEYIWPAGFAAGMELDTPEYLGRVKGDLIVEKQLAKGGIRLAAILNSIFDGQMVDQAEHDKTPNARKIFTSLDWLEAVSVDL